MATCCWRAGFLSNVVDPISWARSNPGWIDISALADAELSTVFSGFPEWLVGDQGDRAWRIYTDTVARFVNSEAGYHHHGEPDAPGYLRSLVNTQFGALVPIIVFAVPTGYINAVTPAFSNAFQFTPALDFTSGGTRDIPEQVKGSNPYYIEFQNWKASNAGTHGVTTESDIDVQLAWIHMRDIRFGGGFHTNVTTLISAFQSRCEVSFSGRLPEAEPNFAEFPCPVIFVSNDRWVADITALADKETVIAGYAHTARPAPSVSDGRIIDGFNRLNPNEQDLLLSVSVNRDTLDWTQSDWEDVQATNKLFQHLRWVPAQEYSAPSDLQGGMHGP